MIIEAQILRIYGKTNLAADSGLGWDSEHFMRRSNDDW